MVLQKDFTQINTSNYKILNYKFLNPKLLTILKFNLLRIVYKINIHNKCNNLWYQNSQLLSISPHLPQLKLLFKEIHLNSLHLKDKVLLLVLKILSFLLKMDPDQPMPSIIHHISIMDLNKSIIFITKLFPQQEELSQHKLGWWNPLPTKFNLSLWIKLSKDTKNKWKGHQWQNKKND